MTRKKAWGGASAGDRPVRRGVHRFDPVRHPALPARHRRERRPRADVGEAGDPAEGRGGADRQGPAGDPRRDRIGEILLRSLRRGYPHGDRASPDPQDRSDRGKLHTGRSRNDQVATDLRLYLREEIDEVLRLLVQIEETVVSRPKSCSGSSSPATPIFSGPSRSSFPITSWRTARCSPGTPTGSWRRAVG